MEADISLEAEDVVDAVDEPEAADETPEAGEAIWGSGGAHQPWVFLSKAGSEAFISTGGCTLVRGRLTSHDDG